MLLKYFPSNNYMLWHILVENSRIPGILSKICGIELEGVTIYPFIFLKNKHEKYLSVYNHELIHIEQIKETFVIGFYPLYFLNFIYNFCKFKNVTDAYVNIVFEKEAYVNMKYKNYLKYRRRYAWIEYI